MRLPSHDLDFYPGSYYTSLLLYSFYTLMSVFCCFQPFFMDLQLRGQWKAPVSVGKLLGKIAYLP